MTLHIIFSVGVSNLIAKGSFSTDAENPYLTLSWNLDCRSDANHTFHLQVFDSANSLVIHYI